MRVVMVSDVFFPRINGVSTAIRTYRESLRSHGIEVTLVAPAYGSESDEGWVRRVPARPVPGDPAPPEAPGELRVGWPFDPAPPAGPIPPDGPGPPLPPLVIMLPVIRHQAAVRPPWAYCVLLIPAPLGETLLLIMQLVSSIVEAPLDSMTPPPILLAVFPSMVQSWTSHVL